LTVPQEAAGPFCGCCPDPRNATIAAAVLVEGLAPQVCPSWCLEGTVYGRQCGIPSVHGILGEADPRADTHVLSAM